MCSVHDDGVHGQAAMSAPWDFDQARDHARTASSEQKAAEGFVKDAYKQFAQKEEAYRVALAKEIVRKHDQDGVAWSVAPDLARGEPAVARLRRERDIAEGVKEAASQVTWRRAADRRDTERFVTWSMRASFQSEPEPDWSKTPVIGERR